MFNFHANFGKITCFEWYNENRIVIGFTSGMISCISTKKDELGQEVGTINTGTQSIDALFINSDMAKLAIAVQGYVKFFTLADQQEITHERIEISKSCGNITSLNWTKDGSIMTVTTN